MKKIYLFASMLFLFIGFTSKAQVVISQVYGGGGNTGAPLNRDFIELFNRGTAAVDISGYTIQYNSATGTSAWLFNTIPAGAIIQPGKYYLIAFGPAGTVGAALPTADFDSTAAGFLALSATNGRVALSNLATAIPAGCPPTGSTIDYVGFGTGNCFEGTAAVAVLSNTTSALRLNGGCTDNNTNDTDFVVNTPTPRNSSTAASVCSTAPTVAITSPVNATIYNPLTTSVTVNVSVSNFTVANGTGTGHIHYTLDGGAVVEKYDTTPIVLNGLAVGNHTVVVTLVNNTHASLSPNVSATPQFTIATPTNVANIAALRAGTLNGY
jgi:hypothetical protein